MNNRTRAIGIVASTVVIVSLLAAAPASANAFWDGFPFGKSSSSSSEVINKLPFKLCERTMSAAGISFTFKIPSKKCAETPPVDHCPNVPGMQTSGPCADEECEDDGGVWDGNSCEFPEDEEPSLDFTVTDSLINEGESTTLEWDSIDADTCTASGASDWNGSKALDGTQIVSPTATTTYTLECENDEGSVTESVTVNVILDEEEPDAPTLDFTVTDASITQGESTTLEWDSTNADSCTASDGWSGAKTLDGSQQVTPNATTTYTLECEGAGGEVTKNLTVNVSIPQEEEGKLLITEVLYDLNNSTTSPQGSEGANEWVEIYNGTDSSVNLSNYVIADASSTDPLPSVVLPAGEFAIITSSSTTVDFWDIPDGTVIVVLSSTIGFNGLGNAGDRVALITVGASTTVDAVSWGTNTQAFSPSVTDVPENSGQSIAREDIEVDTDSAADWETRATPTPGE